MGKFFGYLFSKLVHKFGGDNEDLIIFILIVVLIVIAIMHSVYKEYKKEKINGN